MIILDNALKIRMELIKCRNDNATEKFYLVRTIFKASKISSREALLLYEFSERELG